MNRICPLVLCAFILTLPAWCLAQDGRVLIDKSLIPAEAGDVSKFVPPGWKIEEQVKGDLNGDARSDFVLKLIEDKPARGKDDVSIERQRALVILFQKENDKLARAAVADRLLQCTTCGGILYGDAAPANVTIEKGVIVVEQDHGSRWTADQTFRFRYEPDSGKFLLIGFDYISNDRLQRNTVTESTNYLTGLRIVTRLTRREAKSRTQIPKSKIYLEDIDNEKFEEDAVTRLHL